MNKIFCFFFLSILVTQNLQSIPPKETYLARVREGVEYQIPFDRWSDFKPLVSKMHERELQFQKQYYQLITAQSPLFLSYQIILKAFYKWKYQKSFNDYEFLRAYKDPELKKELWDLFSDYPDLINKEYIHLVQHDPTHPDSKKFNRNIDDDHHKSIRKQLISASLTLETSASGESALFFFLYGDNIMPIHHDFLTELLSYAFGLEKIAHQDLRSFLLQLSQAAPSSKEGLLMQIFIPKEDIFSCLFASHPMGYVDVPNTQDLNGFFASKEAERDSLDFDPDKDMQVRILSGALQPERVKIFRYTTIPDIEVKKYESFVQNELKKFLKKVKN